MNKLCVKCKIIKDCSEFYKQTTSKDGYNSYCKDCSKLVARQTTEKYLIRNRQKSPEELRAETPECRCYRCKRILSSSFFAIDVYQWNGLASYCSDCGSVFRKDFHELHIDYQDNYNKQYYIDHREQCKQSSKEYVERNKDVVRIKARKYESKRLKNDLDYRLQRYLRDNIRKALAKDKMIKQCRTTEILGCNIPFLRTYLTSQFTEGMTWDNYGEWHIDHKKPCAAFDLTDPEQQKICFHHSNLQPLWAKDNRQKNSYYKGVRHYYKNKNDKN